METTFHHVHLFATDLEKSLKFYQDMFGACIVFDAEMAGARNVMIAIGGGKSISTTNPPKSMPEELCTIWESKRMIWKRWLST